MDILTYNDTHNSPVKFIQYNTLQYNTKNTMFTCTNNTVIIQNNQYCHSIYRDKNTVNYNIQHKNCMVILYYQSIYNIFILEKILLYYNHQQHIFTITDVYTVDVILTIITSLYDTFTYINNDKNHTLLLNNEEILHIINYQLKFVTHNIIIYDDICIMLENISIAFGNNFITLYNEKYNIMLNNNILLFCFGQQKQKKIIIDNNTLYIISNIDIEVKYPLYLIKNINQLNNVLEHIYSYSNVLQYTLKEVDEKVITAHNNLLHNMFTTIRGNNNEDNNVLYNILYNEREEEEEEEEENNENNENNNVLYNMFHNILPDNENNNFLLNIFNYVRNNMDDEDNEDNENDEDYM